MAQKPLYKVNTGKNRTLVMLSGGIDSTAALWLVLNKPKEYGEVLVHHVHIQNVEARWKAEADAVKAVLTYMRENAPAAFSYTESSMNTPHFGRHFLYDTEVTGFITGYMTSRDPRITKVVFGATGSDFARGVSVAVARGKALHNAFHEGEGDHSATVKEYPLKDMSKEEVYKTLPPDLAKLTWSCRTPHYADGKAIECGRCRTCRLELRILERPKSAGKRSFK